MGTATQTSTGPSVLRRTAANSFDEDAAFDFGLGLLLDGLERLLPR